MKPDQTASPRPDVVVVAWGEDGQLVARGLPPRHLPAVRRRAVLHRRSWRQPQGGGRASPERQVG
eukprot:4412203-Pyramimonas_sp.AAC.1